MLDFIKVKTMEKSKDAVIVYPDFIMSSRVKDSMIRGGACYAVWDEENSIWSKNLYRLVELVDAEVSRYLSEHPMDVKINTKYMRYESSGVTHRFTKFIKECVDNWHPLDQKPVFLDEEIKRESYATFRLPYSIDDKELGIEEYDLMMDTLYSKEERQKIEWAVGCCLSGEASKVQKFVALYGGPGTGKSTVLHVIEKLLTGYTAPFDAASLGYRANQFALDSFASDPIVVIQHDADMSKIDDNTKFNSVVSHEPMKINEKFTKPYTKVINSFIFIGTNTPIKITEARSGIGRRLIDVSPTGVKLSRSKYDQAVSSISYSLGGIAHRCLEVYKSLGKAYYDGYRPTKMFGLTNDIYSFIEDNYFTFVSQDKIALSQAWKMYKSYAEDVNINLKIKRKDLGNELTYYFKEYKEQDFTPEGTHIRCVYSGFKKELFNNSFDLENEEAAKPYFLILKKQESIFDEICKDLPAQYANEEGTPMMKWANVKTKLSDIDTSKLHYVKLQKNHIVIDFDLKGEDGEKSLERNLQAAREWPATYVETSKSGQGLHLHYFYDGDVEQLSRLVDTDIEVKVPIGDSALRRALTLCNSVAIATISSGLPLKGKTKKMLDSKTIKSEEKLRYQIKRNLNKEIHGATKPSIDFICKILDDAYNSDLVYDVSNMKHDIIMFAANSSNNAEYCVKKVNEMKFKSKSEFENVEFDEKDSDKLVFYDIEVFPNLVLVNWKVEGEDNKVNRMINPSPESIEKLIKLKLIGFNCRRYDNHILYAIMMGYTNAQVYRQSQKIINKEPGCFFGAAYNISYLDVYDMCSEKQSLKKWEIQLGIHHQELGLPWDKPVPEDLWPTVAEYCDNDVIATEAVFHARKADFTARQILADVAGMTVNDTTNSLTTRIIFGKNRNPQNQFNYRFMGDPVPEKEKYQPTLDADKPGADEYTVFDGESRPHFPGYTFDAGVSMYRGEKVGEGGYVYAEPGIYHNIGLLDIASMHPSSIVAENLFGEYTKRFEEILNARIAIKHGDFDKAKTMLDGKLGKYLTDSKMAKALAQALKIAINSVYGLTSAKFENPFKDNRNIDNIVAKRGALFMINLKHEVQKRGFTVAHIKTDSIKIPDATPEIIQFVTDYGKEYGYNFEHEATYDRMCLVNDAVYIAKYATVEQCEKLYGKKYVNSSKDILKDNKECPGEWTATGTQFAVPYVFKTLFTKDKIVLEDMCETKAVKAGDLYIDLNEDLPENQHDYRYIGAVGSFCPIKAGKGGGILYRKKDDKYFAPPGTKGYRWLEAEKVKELSSKKIDEYIDKDYYNVLVDDAIDAIDTISKYGDFDTFIL